MHDRHRIKNTQEEKGGQETKGEVLYKLHIKSVYKQLRNTLVDNPRKIKKSLNN
jgi:hypothetical protein